MKRLHKILTGTAGALTLVAAATVAVAHGGGYGGGQGAGFGGCDGTGPGAAGYGHMGMMHGSMGNGHGGMGAGGMGPGYGGMRGGSPGMMSEQYLAQMKTRLAITAQQESAWQTFATKAAEQAKLMQATHEQHWQQANAQTSAPERMAQHIGTMSQHLAGMQAVNTALSELYTALTPEQRSTADKAFGHMGPRGEGRGMRG